MSRSSTTRVLGIVASLFIVVGLLFAVVGGVLFANTARFLAGAERTTGTVVDLAVSSSTRSSGSVSPVVEFAVDGQTVRFEGNVSSSSARYEIGERVDVVYDPADPTSARIDHFLELHVTPLIFGAIGGSIALTGGGIAGVLLHRRQRQARLRQFGRQVDAEVVRIDVNTSVKIMGRHPYVVHASWRDPGTGQDRVARSELLRTDPRPALDVGHRVQVLVDPDRPTRYLLELPDLSGH